MAVAVAAAWLARGRAGAAMDGARYGRLDGVEPAEDAERRPPKEGAGTR